MTISEGDVTHLRASGSALKMNTSLTGRASQKSKEHAPEMRSEDPYAYLQTAAGL